MKKISAITIDPQVGFCKPSGSLAKAYGVEELAEIERVLPKIKSAHEFITRRHLVLSEYSPAQFTDGDKSNNLSDLCVPFVNEDCHVVSELSGLDYHSKTVKNKQSAVHVQSFVDQIENDVKLNIRHFVIFGFLLEHCVKATAIDLHKLVASRGAEVYVASDLSASRCEKYKTGVVGSIIGDLNESGIRYQSWQSILA